MQTIRFMFQIRLHKYLREMKSVCLVSFILVKGCLEALEWAPTQHLCK